MELINKDIALNGEFANRKESVNGAEPALGAITAGGLDFNALRLARTTRKQQGLRSS